MRQFRADLLLNTTKVFRLRDIFFPESDDVIRRTTAELKVRGRVIDFSDSGSSKNEFAIVQIEGIDGPVVVPVEKLRTIWEEEEDEPQSF
ncbi:MAG TPA: hypothetical protein VM223_19990 [Planctomycetota bacterium]|nr:hypothetical protein [Planctomycetota bacterium]